jgi:predicted RNA-binding protein associated with RNAse of E/G family
VGVFTMFLPTQTIVVSERWHGRLWAAVPHRCITNEDDHLVAFLPRGTAATYASNRDLPQTKALPRSVRKLEAMRTCVYEVVERPIDRSQLHFFTPNRWAHISLFWTDERTFAGWYVNFELPPTPTPDGLESKDLVLDMTIRPDGRWEWKDEADLETAIATGILDASIRPHIDAEARRILAMADAQTGPFAPSWTVWRPHPDWPTPQLPPAYRANGYLWFEHGGSPSAR